jgi:hypothetical protein
MTKVYSCFLFQILLFILCPALAFSEPEADPNTPDFHHKGFLSSLNLGARYSSVLEKRGVILYDGFQIDPIVGVFLFDDKLEFLGDSIGYRDFVAGKWLRLRTRFVSITDKPLFPSTDAIRNGSPDRKDTYEWENRAEFFLPGYNDHYQAEFDLGIAKDLSAHHGTYIDIQAKAKLFDYRIPVLATKVEPNLFGSLGWGDTAHNQYFYGPSANHAGINNFSYGLWFAFPEQADRYYPIVQLTHFQTLGDYRNGEYAQGRNSGWLFSFIATLGVLE